MVLLSLSVGGCAVSGQLGSLFGSQTREPARAYASEDMTNSVRSTDGAFGTMLPEDDLAFARMAIVDVLRRGSKDVSAAWENPRSGARGTVTPIASAYTRDDLTCHDFLASYVQQGRETWLQGEACRARKGRWEIKSLRPWTRS